LSFLVFLCLLREIDRYLSNRAGRGGAAGNVIHDILVKMT